jgi:hypothetical protein
VLPFLLNKHVIVVTRSETIQYIKKENKNIKNISYVETPDLQAYDFYYEIVSKIDKIIKENENK